MNCLEYVGVGMTTFHYRTRSVGPIAWNLASSPSCSPTVLEQSSLSPPCIRVVHNPLCYADKAADGSSVGAAEFVCR